MIRKSLGIIVGLCIALWLGGLVSTLILVMRLWKEADRVVFDQAAPIFILNFEKLELVFSLTGLVAMLGWRLISCSRAKRVVFYALIAASVLLALEVQWIAPHVNQMRLAGEMQTPEFKKYHGYSEGINVGIFLALLVAGGGWIKAQGLQACESKVVEAPVA